MNCTISSIHYCPVKSVSFQNIQLCEIKKNLGIVNDRIFAFSRNIDLEKAKLIEKDAKERKLNYFHLHLFQLILPFLSQHFLKTQIFYH